MAILAVDGRTVAVVIGVSIIALYLRSLYSPKITRHGRRLRNPHNTLPLLGNGIVFLQKRQKLFSWFAQCERLFPRETLAISVPSLPPGVIISDPHNLDFVFRHEGAVFEKGAFFKDRSWDLFGSGIINADGEPWRLQRRAGLHFLSARNLAVLTDVALPRYLDEAAAALAAAADGAAVVDLQGVVHEITTQLMGRMAYNMEMHADDDFTVAFEHASGATAERFQNPLWFLTEAIAGSRLRRSISVVKSYGQRIVSSAVKDRQQGKEGGSSKLDDISGSLIQSLLDSIGDEKLVADSALNYLSAGRDTVAQALTWTFYLLLKHPHVLEKLRSTVESAVPEGQPAVSSLTPDLLTPAKMPYLTAVFYEALRLYPPIPFEIKQARRDTTLPDGTFLPARSVVVWSPWAMNRSRETWGADADAFRPERWLATGPEGSIIVAARSAAEFPVFNGGPRLCLGKRMAELVAAQVVARLPTEYDFVPAFEGERVSRSSLTLPMEGGLPVYVKRRVVS